MKTNETMRNLNVDSDRSAGFFLGDNYHIACKIADTISKEAEEQHEINCADDEDCHGVTPYILRGMKKHFINHPEHTELERLAITSELFHFIGTTNTLRKVQLGKEMGESSDIEDHIRDILGSIPGDIEDIEPESDNDKD